MAKAKKQSHDGEPDGQSNFVKGDLASRIVSLWKSGRSVLWAVTDEQTVCERQTKLVAARLNQENPNAKPVKVVVHDRWSGFRTGLPRIPMCKSKAATFANALQIATMTQQEIEKHFPGMLDPQSDDCLPFSPQEDVIFVFGSCDKELSDQPLTMTLLKNVIGANATSTEYVDQTQGGTRGSRMIVLLTATMQMPEAIPELKPEIVPLPNRGDLKAIALDIFEPMWEDFEGSKGKTGVERFDDDMLASIISALMGLSAQDAEETLALACVQHKLQQDHKVPHLDAFLETIEDEKGKAIAKLPGLRYIPKREIVDHVPPGYELLAEFIDRRSNITSEQAERYGVLPIRGIAMGGPPGVAKTEVAKYVPRRLRKVCLIASASEFKGSLVGQSEMQMRRAIQMGRAMNAVMIWDDIDKGMLGGAARSYGGDGGTTSGMIGLLLTEMSDPSSPIVHVFTFNRVPDMPEILRPGRMDKLLFVERPDGPTRLAIFKDHISRWKMTADDEELLTELAHNKTEGWTGAEIAHVLIKEEAIACLSEDSTEMSVSRMFDKAAKFTPMSRMKQFAADIAAMEEACSQFDRIGTLPKEKTAATSSDRGRARRTVRT